MDVEDTGIGIPPEYLPTVFDKFVQVKQLAESTPGSVGLGLAIAKEMVEMYGGRIWAESDAGDREHLLLPSAGGSRRTGAHGSTAMNTRASILLVDDEPNILRTMRICLEAAEFEITTFANPRAGAGQHARHRL